MINQYDLYDMTYAFICVRNNINYELNFEIISKIESTLRRQDEGVEDNQIRKAVSEVNGLDRDVWDYVYHKNTYVNQRYLRNRELYDLFVKLCVAFKNALYDHNTDMAYDLIDCFHCLPDILVNNNFVIPKSYWKTYVMPFRDKWDKSFLKHEENLL